MHMKECERVCVCTLQADAYQARLNAVGYGKGAEEERS